MMGRTWNAASVRRILATFVAIGAVVAVVRVSFAEPKSRLDPKVADSIAEATSDPIVAADALSDAWLNQKAIDVLEASGRQDPPVLWRIARSQIDIGENMDEKEAEPYFQKAMTLSEKAVQEDSTNAHAHQTLAIACGRIALLRGPFKAASLVKQAYHEALLATALNDSMPIALYVIGRTHKKLMEKPGIIRKLAGLGFASDDSVAYYFKKALKVSHGDMIQCRVEYADFLLETRKDPKDAKPMLEAALALPLRDEQDGKAQARAKKMLAELQSE